VEYDHNNKPLRLCGTHQDITNRKQADEVLKEAIDKFRALVETTHDFIWEVTADGFYSYCSPQIKDILGYRPDELLGKTPFEFMPLHEAKQAAKIFNNFVAHQAPFKALENIHLSKDGLEVVLETSGVPFFSTSGELQGYRGIDRDITERKQAEIKLHHMATHDPLTDLYNRKILIEKFADDLFRAYRYDRPLSIFMLDIDHFKLVNDIHGHQAGDIVLQDIAKVLSDSIRKTDYAARYGGEEFIIVLPETPLTEADELAERLRKEVAALSIQIMDDKEHNITTSIGVATFPDHAQSWEDLLNAADSAMYAAKGAGRNCVRVATKTL